LHVGGDGPEHLATNALGVLYQVLDGKLTDDATQMTFHDQANQVFAVLLGLAQELLCGSLDALIV
jgi:hypothetical protein